MSQFLKKQASLKTIDNIQRNKSLNQTQSQKILIKKYNIDSSNPNYSYYRVQNRKQNPEYFGMTEQKVMSIISPQQTPTDSMRKRLNNQQSLDSVNLKRKKIYKDIRTGQYLVENDNNELNNSNNIFANKYQSHYQQQYQPNKQVIMQSRVHNHNQEVGTKYLTNNKDMKRHESQGKYLPSLNSSVVKQQKSQQQIDKNEENYQEDNILDQEQENNNNNIKTDRSGFQESFQQDVVKDYMQREQQKQIKQENLQKQERKKSKTMNREQLLQNLFDSKSPQNSNQKRSRPNSQHKSQDNIFQQNQQKQFQQQQQQMYQQQELDKQLEKKCQNDVTPSQSFKSAKNKVDQKNIEQILSILTDNQDHKFDAQLHEFIKENPDFLLHMQKKCACFQCNCGKCSCKASRDVISKPSYQNLKSMYKTTFNTSHSNKLNNCAIQNKIYQQPPHFQDNSIKDKTTNQVDYNPSKNDFNQDQFQPIRRDHKVNRDLKFFNPQTSYDFDFPRYDNYDRFIIKNVANITTNDKMPFIKNTTYQTSFKNGNNFSSQRVGNQKALDDLQRYNQQQNLISLKPEESTNSKQFKSFKIDPKNKTQMIRYQDNDPLPNGAPSYHGQFESLTSKTFKVNAKDRETQSVDNCPVQNEIRNKKQSSDLMRESMYSVSSSRSGLKFQFKPIKV